MIRRFLEAIAARGHKAPGFAASDTEAYREIAAEGAEIIDSAWSVRPMTALEAALRNRFSLHPRRDVKSGHLEANLAAVQAVPGLARVFMHHGDGRVRQEAIKAGNGPLADPSEAAALAWRLNDWVAPIREAAASAARRRLPQTPADILVPALFDILPVIDSWGRWSQNGPQIVYDLLWRVDVADLLARGIMASRRARAGAVFRQACRSPLIDPFLMAMAAEAQMPHIRAMALDCVLSGKARIPTRDREAVWVDKSMGLSRMQRRWIVRDLTVAADRNRCLERGATDRSPTVRRRVAQGLIDLMQDPGVEGVIGRLARALENDRSKAVRERIAFIRRHGVL